LAVINLVTLRSTSKRITSDLYTPPSLPASRVIGKADGLRSSPRDKILVESSKTLPNRIRDARSTSVIIKLKTLTGTYKKGLSKLVESIVATR